MGFEWDPEKNAANLAKHGLSFDDAPLVFAGDLLVAPDTRHAEPRFLALGRLGARPVIVAYTLRGENVRVISMRYAHAREARRFKTRVRPR